MKRLALFSIAVAVCSALTANVFAAGGVRFSFCTQAKGTSFTIKKPSTTDELASSGEEPDGYSHEIGGGATESGDGQLDEADNETEDVETETGDNIDRTNDFESGESLSEEAVTARQPEPSAPAESQRDMTAGESAVAEGGDPA